MKTPNFENYSGLNEAEDPLNTQAREFVKKILGLPGRGNAIEEWANKNDLNYMDFAGAVIEEISRQFAM